VTTFIQSIPFIAGDSTWEGWNGNMLHYFGQEPLPYLPEEQWRDFALTMIGLPTFSTFGLPGPESFETWQDWVTAIVGMVNGPTQ
jgi:hypothetical protein